LTPLIALNNSPATVRGRLHYSLRGDIATTAQPILDDERRAEALREPLADKAREDVLHTTGHKADDDAHRPRRIGMRPCDEGQGRQSGGTRGQMQKLPSVGKFHSVLL
jgi:hypothetical protein